MRRTTKAALALAKASTATASAGVAAGAALAKTYPPPSIHTIDSAGTVRDLSNLIPAKSGHQLTGASATSNIGQITATTSTGHAVLLTPS